MSRATEFAAMLRKEFGNEDAYPLRSHAIRAADELERLDALLNTPELRDFAVAVEREAAHQRERWGEAHDIAKEPADWFWTVGYLAGKALTAAITGNTEKALHHVITTAAVLNNWHARLLGKWAA